MFINGDKQLPLVFYYYFQVNVFLFVCVGETNLFSGSINIATASILLINLVIRCNDFVVFAVRHKKEARQCYTEALVENYCNS